MACFYLFLSLKLKGQLHGLLFGTLRIASLFPLSKTIKIAIANLLIKHHKLQLDNKKCFRLHLSLLNVYSVIYTLGSSTQKNKTFFVGCMLNDEFLWNSQGACATASIIKYNKVYLVRVIAV